MKLRDIAHIRTGDKGNVCNIAVILYDPVNFDALKAKLTSSVVKNFYCEQCRGEVKRYEVPSIGALNFVLSNALDGGVTRSLAIDRHGKSLGMALGELEL
ncbi:MAG: hypothetical protein LKF61_03725 [Eggerthellaceae bacterium]|jgi:hypothetical protein|nr:hypothetical protein [Eggerthellaceae bacterium]MCH4221221.1 hypothetical protein [Eggerthellaceae bacterium]